MNEDKKNNLKAWLFLFFIFLGGSLIYYSSTMLPNNYRKDFIEKIKNNEIKKVYFYDYIYFNRRKVPENKKNLEILKWLKKMKPSDDGEFCRSCSILRFLNERSFNKPKEVKNILPYLNDWSRTGKGEYIRDPLLLKIILKTNEVIWLKFGRSNKSDIFIVDFDFEFKEAMKYKGVKYLFFRQSSYGTLIVPSLEKFFDEFKLSQWKKENRERLNKNRDK